MQQSRLGVSTRALEHHLKRATKKKIGEWQKRDESEMKRKIEEKKSEHRQTDSHRHKIIVCADIDCEGRICGIDGAVKETTEIVCRRREYERNSRERKSS